MNDYHKQPDLKIRPGARIHMIGIGGASMSGLALMLHRMGYCVTGSNNVEDPKLQQLRESGIPVWIDHDPQNAQGADLAIYTTAVTENNPELEACRRCGIPLMDRPTLLGYLSDMFRQSIAVWGPMGRPLPHPCWQRSWWRPGPIPQSTSVGICHPSAGASGWGTATCS